MHVFQVAFYTSGALYALFVDRTLFLYFLAVIAIYMGIAAILPGAKNISTRKKLMLGTWSPPSEGVIVNKQIVRVEKVQKLLDEMPKEGRPTLTHFVVKGCGELLKAVPDINGKLVFGRFVPYETTDVSILVDIDGGKDLAFIKVADVGSIGVLDIAAFIKEKVSKMKKTGGGEQHKKRSKPFAYIPAFIASIMLNLIAYVSNVLGIGIKALKVEKNAFGAMVVTSLGMLGFQDATAPFSAFTNSTFTVSCNAVHEAAVVEDGKLVVGKVMVVNFAVDHRYVDGGQCKTLTETFKRVFEHPEEYMNSKNEKKTQ